MNKKSVASRPPEKEGGFWMSFEIADLFVKEFGSWGNTVYMGLCYYRSRGVEQDLMRDMVRLGMSPDEFARMIVRAHELGLIVEVPAKVGTRAFDYVVPEDQLLRAIAATDKSKKGVEE